MKTWSNVTGNRIPKDLEERLKKIQDRGYEERASYEIRGVTNISYPILDERGTALAALTVPYLARIEESTSPKNVHTAMRTASRELTEAVGGMVSQPVIAKERKSPGKSGESRR